MATSVIGVVPTFDPGQVSFDEWSEILEAWLDTNEITNAEKKRSVLFTSMGAKTYHVLRSILQPEKPAEKTFNDCIKALKNHYQPQVSEIVLRYRFHSRYQKPGEGIAKFVAELRRLSDGCNFVDLDTMLRDRLVVGVQDIGIQRKLLSEKDLKFENALAMATAMEMANKDVQDIKKAVASNATVPPDKVNKLSGKKLVGKPKHKDKIKPPSKAHVESSRPATKRCWRCGSSSHEYGACPFKNEKCHSCDKIGHTKSQCEKVKEFYRNKAAKKAATNHLHFSDEFDEQGSAAALMHMQVNSLNSAKPQPYELNVLVNGTSITFEVDTGSPWTVISAQMHTQLALPPCDERNIKLTTYNGSPVELLGSVKVQIQLAESGKSQTATLLVAKSGVSILGRSWLELLGIDIKQVVANANCNEKLEAVTGSVNVISPMIENTLDEILLVEQDVFDTSHTGKLQGFQAKVYPIENASPKFYKPYPLPYAIHAQVDKALDELLGADIIEPVKFAEYACPLVIVKKPDGKVRICGNYKLTANQVLKLEQYPIPTFEDLMQSLQGGKRWSKLDLSHAYHQIELEPEARQYTTINTHRGLFQYKRLPFGVASAPSIFQRTIDSLVGDIPMVKAYLDDLIITGRTDQEHLENLQAVLARLNKHGMKLRRDKCEFFKESVTYLGHVLDASGIRPVAAKVDAIQNAPEPENVEQLQAYLGLLGYYRRFCPNLSKQIAPLTELLRKDSEFRFEAVHRRAFQLSKKLICSDALLVHYDPKKPLLLQTDSSSYGLGAVISHTMSDGTERPIAFASRTLTPSEKNYAQYEKEALSVIFGVKKFHQYLLGRHFTIVTDHLPLVTSLGNKPLSPMASTRMARWQTILGNYQYNIVHKIGKLHNNADCLSRLPLPSSPDKQLENEAVQINLLSDLDTSPITAAELKVSFAKDSSLVKVRRYLQTGWPAKQNVAPELQTYFTKREVLNLEDGLILWGNRVVIPDNQQLRSRLLSELHATHPGIAKMKALARSYFWWYKIDADLEATVRACASCQENQRNPETVPIHPWEYPENPWERLHLDFAQIEGQEVLIVVDAHSKWIEALPMRSTTAEATVKVMRNLMARFGVPATMVTDNGPQFVSEEFFKFLTQNGVKYI